MDSEHSHQTAQSPLYPNDLRSLIPEWFEQLDESEVREILRRCGPKAGKQGFVRGFYWSFNNARSPLSVSTPSQTYYGNVIIIEADSLILCAGTKVVAFIPYAFITAINLLYDAAPHETAVIKLDEFIKNAETQT